MATRAAYGFALSLLISGSCAFGQNLEVFALDDFVEPALLEFSAPEGGVHHASLLTSTVQVGQVWNYQRLSTPTDENLHFLRVSNNYYYKSFQAAAKLTLLEKPGDKENTIVANRFTLEGGYYFKTREAAGEDELVPYTNRVRFAWDRESLTGGEVANSFSLGVDYTPNLDPDRLNGVTKRIEGIMSGWNFTWREGVNGHDEEYLSVNTRAPIRQYSNDSRLWAGWSLGGERTLGHTRWGAARLELAYDLPVDLLNSRVRLVYSPSYQIARGEYSQEISLFVSPPVFGRFFGIPRD